MECHFLNEKDMEQIEKHYDTYFLKAGAKKSGNIWHEIASDGMHIDLLPYLPTEKFPYNIVATMGMSAYKQTGGTSKRLELFIILPKDWKLDGEAAKDEKWYWPILMLKCAARLPYSTSSYLDFFHTFSMDAGNTPFHQETKMCSGMLVFPVWFDEGIADLKYGGLFNKKTVHFLCLIPLTQEELDLKRKIGANEFTKRLRDKEGKLDLVTRDER
ncbi:hypothetical protein FACS1894211_08930 [Clostridia bacterium]|nr:hypothetical protein FACS1894211_08930 [Clostridia bacterium]